MLIKKTAAILILMALIACKVKAAGKPMDKKVKEVTIANSKLNMTLDFGKKASIVSFTINGQKVISGGDGIFTSITAGGITYSSLHLTATPIMVKIGNVVKLNNISYGDKTHHIEESWIFTITTGTIKWIIERTTTAPLKVEESATPEFDFDNIKTWEGAYQGYGGLAWFYLFNEKLCTYGVHTRSSAFWNSETNNGLNIAVNVPGENVAMKYSRMENDKLAYTVSVSDKELLPKLDSGTNRRRFLRGRTDVWSSFNIPAGTSRQNLTFSYFDFKQKYGRGKFNGIDGEKVSAVLNTIARIGVIDSLHYGGNSWATPYGPICLHEQYIAQLGLAINDPNYLKGYQTCLDYYCSHAIKPDGRVYPRWAYTNEDAMAGKFNKYGFYEAQWGILMDSNPDLVSNIADLYNMTGNTAWVKTHLKDCEKALDWILKRDSNNNGLVEMMSDNERDKRSSDWIDIVWASYENAFVNAKLYHALMEWGAIEQQFGRDGKAAFYLNFAARLKATFNKSIKDGGFWDEENSCYDYWIDKDKSVHGRNIVTPVNFMAIAYGICDNNARKKIILDQIEAQMKKESLFFWPLALYSYAPGEAKQSQYPFPSYENGDLFLSWGSIGVKAYADYDPAIALKYVRNVLAQYGKDGLAFQRYGRIKQDGLGDDILAGNSLAIVGLYQAIYGINPLYNRFYLNPHITSELAGTSLNYNFRGKRLTINLDNACYAVTDQVFKVTAPHSFGFNTIKNRLLYFDRSSPQPSLTAQCTAPLTITIQDWGRDNMSWMQIVNSDTEGPVSYEIHQLKNNTDYQLSVKGKPDQNLRSGPRGDLMLRINGISKITLTELY